MATGGTGRQPATLTELAPGLTAAFVREALHRAIHGVGPLPPAAAAADKQLQEQQGDVDRAIHEVIENHVRFAGAQGFVTNLGGLVTMAVTSPPTSPASPSSSAGWSPASPTCAATTSTDPRVRNAILVSMLGEDAVDELVAGTEAARHRRWRSRPPRPTTPTSTG